LVLLVSSLVQAKCTNSLAARSSVRASDFDLSQYSAAFTSWLVVFSISLIAAASASETFFNRPRRSVCAPGLDGLNTAEPATGRAMNQQTSTCTRLCM